MALNEVVIVGLGGRGGTIYAHYQDIHPDRMKIVAIADIDPKKVKYYGDKYSVPTNMRFSSAEELLKQEKLAESIIIATQDRQHVLHALAALDKGYHLILEKPIAVTLKDCIAIQDKAEQLHKHIVVCHVLRYTKFYGVIKELIKRGEIGDLVSIQAIENVGFWHYAHSFTRGNWKNDQETSPMILQKCCHDLDIFQWLIEKKCLRLSSFGSLYNFKTERAPKGSAEYCFDAKECRKTCPYDAYKIYIENKDIGVRTGSKGWPLDCIDIDPTEEKLIEKLPNNKYGKCVYRCNNNVVDHQIVNLEYENGITVNFTMSGFTAKNTREIKLMGTVGEIYANMDTNLVTLTPFGKDPVVYDISKLTNDLSCHGGGDNAMLDDFFDLVEGKKDNLLTDIRFSVASHALAFAAEYSRKNNGEVVNIDKFIEDNR